MYKVPLSSVDSNGEADPADLDEMPIHSDARWSALDFRGGVAAAKMNPEDLKAALVARLGRIDAARDEDPWAELPGDVGVISRQVNVLASNVEAPADATHKIVGGLFADSYARAPVVTEDGKAFNVMLVSGLRRGRSTRVDFNQFVKVDGQPDYKLEVLLNVEAKGKPRTSMGANKLRIK